MNKKILTPTVTRRELVQSTAAVLSLFAIGAAAKAEKAPALIRPPKSELLGVAYTQIRNPDSNLSLLGRS